MTRIAILGAGMAGFGAAHRLSGEGASSVMFEAKPHHGGHTASFVYDGGFIFDEGPHVSFTKVERIQKLFAHSVNDEYEILQTRVNNYWRGQWIKHPAQCNLHGLPTELVVRVIRDFVAAAQASEDQPRRTYEEWLVAAFGRTFAETFPMEYGFKYHTTTADNMSTDWMGPRLYRPSLEEVLRGALSPTTPDVHYIDHFRYPTRNGFVSYLNAFVNQTDVRLNHRVTNIDPVARELWFADGTVHSYTHLISSLPLPELVGLIARAPHDVSEAAARLACSSVVLVNISLARDDISEAHWSYFYDRDVIFTRLSFPHMQSPHNVPAGTGSIQAEVYYSQKYRPLDRTPDACIEPVIADLRRCGLIREDDTILFQNASFCPYANVIFDLERTRALGIVHGYLRDLGIEYCGRYGDWGYYWTDDSFMSGERAAQSVLDQIGSGAVVSGDSLALGRTPADE